MGVSLYVEGYRKADEQWNKMKAIWNACHDAKISVPKEVDVFFDYHNPNKMTGKKIDISSAIVEYSGDCASGFEIDITRLPKDIRHIRAYLS